ncbi:MAG TPA: hypothetical protein VKD08_13200 [Ignavibacteriaceae bacterium]|nr:hypothetical protein [Ignavibacteriaceae bacterium]
MNLIKQYLVQAIANAANSLRLSTQKIEVVGLLKEVISRSDDIENDIKKMKKITQFSTLAIRLNEIYNYLDQPQVEMGKLSDKFREHSQFLVKDLNNMLEIVNPLSFKEAVKDLHAEKNSAEEEIKVDLSKRSAEDISFENQDRESIKEKIIMDDDREDDQFFQNYESTILKPIKPLDAMLKTLADGQTDKEDLVSFADTLSHNAEVSSRAGFEIIANMHKIVARALRLINKNNLTADKETIESMRACLIVIVAVVRGKEVNITNYLNRAEEFGERIDNLTIKENTQK